MGSVMIKGSTRLGKFRFCIYFYIYYTMLVVFGKSIHWQACVSCCVTSVASSTSSSTSYVWLPELDRPYHVHRWKVLSGCGFAKL